jgi:hypothetical protein
MKRGNASWKLMTADNAPLVISFLNEAFILPNSRILSESVLMERLEDKLFFLREQAGHESFPRKSVDYLKEWAEPDKGWLRRFYPDNSDEPHYDITPAAEKAISWVNSLASVSFVGTESRLKTIFDLIRQMVEGSESDEEVRIAELKKRRGEIDAEIAKIERGELSLLDSASLKDRFYQLSTTAMDLLSDFRSVEYNFRELDRSVRERIALWEEGKGALLDEILGKHDAISDSDQGRSFRAFMDFLLSRRLQQELEELLGKVMEMPAVREMSPDRRLARIHTLWLDASTHVQEVAASLSSQLRGFLDNSVWMENRRIGEIFRHIQENAIKVKNDPPRGNFMEIDDMSVEIKLIMERPLFAEKSRVKIESSELLIGDSGEIDTSALYEVMYVDTAALEENIKLALLHVPQITLAELLARHRPERGLAEIIAYMNIASKRDGSIFDDAVSDEISWRNGRGSDVAARAPRVIFTR